MKRFLLTVLVSAITFLQAAERKPIGEIDTDSFTTATMPSFSNVGDDHVAMAWWIPREFWGAIFARDPSTSEADKKAMMDTLSEVTLMAVVQADISNFGAFSFYSMDEIRNTMKVSFVNADGSRKSLKTMTDLSPDLEVLLGVFKPILGAAMGNLGTNMHFFVFDDQKGFNGRVLDPYGKGELSISLNKKNKDLMEAAIEFPLDILYVPRKCPNGKDAHISWKFCPWTGEALP